MESFVIFFQYISEKKNNFNISFVWLSCIKYTNIKCNVLKDTVIFNKKKFLTHKIQIYNLDSSKGDQAFRLFNW